MSGSAKSRAADVARSIWRSRLVAIGALSSNSTARLTQMRAELGKSNVNMKFVKGSVAGVVVQDEFQQRSVMQDMLSGQVVFLYSDEPDPIKTLKAINALEKENENLMVLGATFDDMLLSTGAIKEAIALPDLTQLRADLISALLTPAANVASTLSTSKQRAQALVQALETPQRQAAAAMGASAKTFARVAEARKMQLDSPPSPSSPV